MDTITIFNIYSSKNFSAAFRTLKIFLSAMLAVFLLFSQVPSAVFAAQTGGVLGAFVGSSDTRPPAVSNVSDVTGAFEYSYDVTVPPGRNGLEPSISLTYDSQSRGNGLFGIGWNLNIPHIQRLNKTGTDNLYEDDYFFSSLDGELVATDTPRYVPKVETGNFHKYEYENDSWTVTDKQGTLFKFGYSSTTREEMGSATIYVKIF